MENADDDRKWKAWSIGEIDSDTLEKVSTEWEAEAGSDEFQAEMSFIFSAIDDDLGDTDSSASYFVLRQNGTSRAILELIDTKRGAMTKLLSLHLSPTYWDVPSPEMVSEVYTAAIANTLSVGTARAITRRPGKHEIKIYGRNRELLDILRAIDDNWVDIENVTIQMAGRWLSVVIV